MLHSSFRIVAVMFVTVAPELFDYNPSILDLMVMLPEQSARWVSRRNVEFTGPHVKNHRPVDVYLI